MCMTGGCGGSGAGSNHTSGSKITHTSANTNTGTKYIGNQTSVTTTRNAAGAPKITFSGRKKVN